MQKIDKLVLRLEGPFHQLPHLSALGIGIRKCSIAEIGTVRSLGVDSFSILLNPSFVSKPDPFFFWRFRRFSRRIPGKNGEGTARSSISPPGPRQLGLVDGRQDAACGLVHALGVLRHIGVAQEQLRGRPRHFLRVFNAKGCDPSNAHPRTLQWRTPLRGP